MADFPNDNREMTRKEWGHVVDGVILALQLIVVIVVYMLLFDSYDGYMR